MLIFIFPQNFLSGMGNPIPTTSPSFANAVWHGKFVAMLMPMLLLLSCSHNNTTNNNPIQSFVPPNNCLNQIIAIKDSSSAIATNFNQVINVSSLDRTTGNTFSAFNTITGAIDPYDHQSCIINNTLYFLLRNNAAPGSILKTVDLTTQLPNDILLPNWYLSYLVYQTGTGIFYARSHYASGDSLAAFSLSGNTVTNFHNLVGIPADVNAITINQNNGKIYLSSGTTVAHLQVYNNTTLTELALSDNSALLYGLRYSSNNNALYAFSTNTMFKIDAANGTRTALINFPRTINHTFYGAAVDDCNNQIIISSFMNNAADSGMLMVYDFAAAKMATYYLPAYCYMAITIK
jgi:hypothetical protein